MFRAIYNALPQSVQQKLRHSSRAIALSGSRYLAKGIEQGWHMFDKTQGDTSAPEESNPLLDYFNANLEGHGIWKWKHYFEVYHRHFQKFRGRKVNIMEIGIYSGGSLGMWKQYFGDQCTVYGVDIEPKCKAYDSDSVKVFIGDQADRGFWKKFRDENPPMDIVIDDGGHFTHQMIVTLEEMLPYMAPGGVFVCEDVHSIEKEFTHYVQGLTCHLNNWEGFYNNFETENRTTVPTNSLQKAVQSIAFYPFMTVIERNTRPVNELLSIKHGTKWQPHLT
jgi:hypothetical protein